jgi:hypothetical protein
MWRGGGRLGLSVAASFVWRCPSNVAMAPFPHPAHRTGHADFPHPALGQDITPARVTPPAVPEHFAEFNRLPNLRALTASCVSPELRLLPSTGITRLPRYYEPLRHPMAPESPSPVIGCSARSTPWGFPCCLLSPIPRRGGWDHRFCSCFPQPCQPSPIRGSGRPAHRPFRGLLSVHSRYGLHTRHVTVFRDALITRGFNCFVTSTVAPVASGWSISPGGTLTHWKAPPFHGAPPKQPFVLGCMLVYGTAVITTMPVARAIRCVSSVSCYLSSSVR